MKWILIIWFTAGLAGGMTSIPFNSKINCDRSRKQALSEINGTLNPIAKAVCIQGEVTNGQIR